MADVNSLVGVVFSGLCALTFHGRTRLASPVLGCPRQTFREQVSGLLGRYQRRTNRLTDQLGSVVTRQGQAETP